MHEPARTCIEVRRCSRQGMRWDTVSGRYAEQFPGLRKCRYDLLDLLPPISVLWPTGLRGK